jgi:tetratricopeptide (TPR) repeat protein
MTPQQQQQQQAALLQNEQQQRRLNQLVNEAQAAYNQGRRPQAEQLANQVLQMAPGHLGALRMKIAIAREMNNLQQAETLMKQALSIHPNNDQLLFDSAVLLEQMNRPMLAEQQMGRVVSINPQNFQAQVAFGRMKQRRGNMALAEYHLRQAHFLNSAAPDVCVNLGNALTNMGRWEEAEHFFRVALALDTENIPAYLGWVKLEESQQNFPRAWELLEMAKDMRPKFPNIAFSEALLYRGEKDYDKALAALDRLKVDNLNPAAKVSYYYDRGTTLDKMKKFDEAFADFSEANRINREDLKVEYGEDKNKQLQERLMAFFTAENIAGLTRAKRQEGDENPIFIVGFTRSGTSMTEQILTAHSQIAAGDELHYMNDLAERASGMLRSRMMYPNCLAEANQQAMNAFRNDYLLKSRMAGIVEPGIRRFTDKMPGNEMHMGMISLLFPETHFVHMVRHPLDSVLASFFIDARHGDNYACSLESAAKHYALTSEVVDHYEENLDMNYERFKYEDGVTNVEKQAKKMIDFLDLEWEDGCAEYYKNDRHARTPSYAQVKQKPYKTSMYRYLNYMDHLKDIIPTLEPVIKKLGYKID